MSTLLEIDGLDVAYGASQVLFGLSLAIEEGQVATLLGRNGMGKTTTIRALFGLTPPRSGEIRFRGERVDRRSPDFIGRLGLALVPEGSHMGTQLSGGEQQMLAIGRALMTNPRLLVLDEATEGLAPLIREEIWRCLSALKAEGQTILVIDKYVERLTRIADHHTIIERGRVAWQGDSTALAADPGLWHRYLGV